MSQDDTTSGEQPLVLDADEAAALMRIHPSTLRRLVREGRCPVNARHIGNRLRFSRLDVVEWAQG